MKNTLKTLGLTVATAAMMITYGAATASAKKHPKEKPTITMEQARQAAMKAVPDGKILSAELEHEDGQFIYSFDMRVQGGVKEVWVDAKTGQVTSTKNETPAQEKRERAAEKHKH